MKNEQINAAHSNVIYSFIKHFLLGVTLTLFLSGCFKHEVKNFSPEAGPICSYVHITGTFYHIGKLEGVWFNGVKSTNAHFTTVSPYEIVAQVPDNATTGPIRVDISTGGGIVLGVVGTDYTFPYNYIVSGSPNPPTIVSFTSDVATIKDGEPVTLKWTVSSFVTKLHLNGVDVTGTNSKTLTPATTTTYNLVANNESCLERSSSLTVTVVPGPKISSLAKSAYHPNEKLIANGLGLSKSGEISQLVFVQGTTNTPITDPSPSASQLDALVPSSLIAGPATVQAKVGTEVSNVVTFTVDARLNGPFVEMTSTIGQVAKSCNTKQMQISFNSPGFPQPSILATFLQGTTTLTQHNFKDGQISGAAFSPKCDQAVSVGLQSNVPPAQYLAVVERFGSGLPKFQVPVIIMEGASTVLERYHILFSPDDKIVIISSVPNPSASSNKMVIVIHDMSTNKDLTPAIFTNCTACKLQAEVINGANVKVTLDGIVVGTYAIF